LTVVIGPEALAKLEAPNASADEQNVATEGLVDKKALACTKRKQEGNSGGRTCKKAKVS
jgi:hypothetical protein